MSLFRKDVVCFIKCITFFIVTKGLLLPNAQAADVAIKVSGKIMLPPCVINENKPFELDFGTVYIRDVIAGTGDKINKKITLPVKCLGNNGLKVKVSSNGNAVKGNTLEVSGVPKSGLGVSFYDVKNSAFNLNTYADFNRFGSLSCKGTDCSGFLNFNMTLVQYNSRVALTPTDFNTTATLVLEWQ